MQCNASVKIRIIVVKSLMTMKWVNPTKLHVDPQHRYPSVCLHQPSLFPVWNGAFHILRDKIKLKKMPTVCLAWWRNYSLSAKQVSGKRSFNLFGCHNGPVEFECDLVCVCKAITTYLFSRYKKFWLRGALRPRMPTTHQQRWDVDGILGSFDLLASSFYFLPISDVPDVASV